MSVLSPFVFWAQNEKSVFLKIDLKDVQDPKIQLEPCKLRFESKGVGARGLNQYGFQLDFHAEINTQKSVHKITDNRVEFTIEKNVHGWWPRLLSHMQKPIWLKIDHDRFQSEDIVEDEKDIMHDYPNLYEKLQREEFGYKKEDFKKVYLTIYNLFMLVGFTYVVSVLCVRYLRDGAESFSGTYAAVGPAICFLHLTQLLEIMHVWFGYLKGNILVSSIQIIGRIFIILMLEFEPRIQKMPVVFYLFAAWASIEIIRYPYYLSRLLHREIAVLTWLRYTLWAVDIPIGFMCESVIIFRNIIFMEQDSSWTWTFTNPLEITIKLSNILRVFLLFAYIPIMYFLMSHMYKARQRKFNAKNRIKKQK